MECPIICMDSIDRRELDSFSTCLRYSRRIAALIGAGLSAPSGISTYRGAGGHWHQYDVKKLATPQGFQEDPYRVWRFNAEMKHHALQAQPNAGHYALAEFAKRRPDLFTISQNVDSQAFLGY